MHNDQVKSKDLYRREPFTRKVKWLKDLAFYMGFGMFLTHELDAVLNHEWRVLPLIRALPEETAIVVFVAAHVPIFAVLIALVASENYNIRSKSRVCVGLFLLFHALLHVQFKDHPSYEFSSFISNLLIFGGSAFGAIFLVLEWIDKHTRLK